VNVSRPVAAPRPSAAAILLRGSGESLQVYWALRSDVVSYMPGFRGFVGGSVDPGDESLEVAGLTGDDRVLRACAIREAFEETGVLLGTREPVAAATLDEARRRLLAGEAGFGELAREHGWRFDGAGLAFAGRWVTPPFAPRRFETAFYVARIPAGQEPTVRVGELESGEWVRPIDALRRWQQGYETFAAPILYTLIGLAHGDEGIAERLAEAPEAAAAPVRRIELKWGIVLQPMKTRPLPPATHTNAYLVGEPEMALIDPGSGEPEELERLFELIGMLEDDRRRLAIVLLTHHHPDHVGGLAAVRERYPKVRVAAHAETARHVAVDLVLGDGDWIPLVPGVGDWSLQAIHTPGHTRGHLCFLHPRTRSLFSGDTVVGGTGTVIIDPPEGDMADYIASLRRLLEHPVETLFPGHGGPQGAARKRIAALLAHREAREARVLAALGAEPRSIPALLERVYDDTPRELWPYAERSLLAHLLKLEREGRARAGDGRWSAA